MFKSTFFSTKTLEEIHKHISPPKIIDNFINESEIKELINYLKQLDKEADFISEKVLR